MGKLEEKWLKEWKSMQQQFGCMVCPRCGQKVMFPNPIDNALSRHHDIYICSECGLKEALMDCEHKTEDLSSWYFAEVKEE